MRERMNMSDGLSASVLMRTDINELIRLAATYHVRHYRPSKSGRMRLLHEQLAKNLVVYEGKNKVIDTALRNQTQIATWYMGLKGTGSAVNGDTLASHVKELPADVVKIDGSFIRSVNAHPANLAIVEAIVELGRNFGMQTIAEWAEDRATVVRFFRSDIPKWQIWDELHQHTVWTAGQVVANFRKHGMAPPGFGFF